MPRPGNPGARLYPSAETLVARAKLGATSVGFAVADAETGEMLEGMNPELPLPPASVAKALTALYGMERLGADHRFATRLVATGPVEAGVLKGDLVLVGSGDPTLDTDRLAELASQLKASGISKVEGDFLTWDAALPNLHSIDPGQPDQVGYNPAVSGLNLNFNRVHFEWRKSGSGWNVAMDARSANRRPDVRVSRMEIVRRKYPIYTYEDAGDIDRWTVASGALGTDGARWLPVRKPTAYTAEVFQILAGSLGITLPAARLSAALPTGQELARVESEDLREVVRGMLKYSTNLTAEAVGLAASAAAGPRPDTLTASAGRMCDWVGSEIGGAASVAPALGSAMGSVGTGSLVAGEPGPTSATTGPALIDHSGLGGDSRISAQDMVRALVTLGPRHDLEPLLKSIRMKDTKGRPIANYPVKILAKTGTLNFVSGLAGYAVQPDGRRLAFATFVADVPRREALTRAQRERPDGMSSWVARARRLQLQLIDRWSGVYSA
ncbi:D-alanyl-D-alanine carboxypeptidase [Tropicimonas sp. TH_r6]|uniref:D-alanyl-D-alanine carboxypeptidase/D-alanyl-D-alanine-endopeptidase n=1 Tax=Tropicimonas sp. TH_r6 TaxID=3082085 RepID=UPI0029538190|nr:D-alanyl-D-alanine carboxypeptidase [Tropicimonas sp. TH_r6]MDV7141985.1 D-alanyl-D-alanine carboxypeptidase [Tropicimonas sp. TH_r6]